MKKMSRKGFEEREREKVRKNREGQRKIEERIRNK